MRSDVLLDTAPMGGSLESAIAAADPTVAQHPVFLDATVRTSDRDVCLAADDVVTLTAEELEDLSQALDAIETEDLEFELRNLCDDIAESYTALIASALTREWGTEIRPSILDRDMTLDALLEGSLTRAKTALEARRAQWD